MSTSLNTHLGTPWYRHRWPWVLMTVPFAAVLFGILMISTATLYPDDVVVDTYYKDGQGINQLRELDDTAHALGLRAALSHDETTGSTQLHLSGTEEAWLQLSLFHVTDSAQDRSVRFRAQGAGDFVSEETFLNTLFADRGVWYLELRGVDGDWRLRQRIETPIRTLEL